MKKVMFCCLLLAMFFISGCVIRTYTTEMDRVDQEISGNRGFIMGTPSAAIETPEARKTRKIYNVEVELPSGYRTAQEIRDRELYGNRGYVQGRMTPEKEIYVPEKEGGQVSGTGIGSGLGSAGMPQVIYSESSGNATAGAVSPGSGKESQYYVVQKGDTLQKISQKFFGTTRRWKGIYDANKQVLKTPDRIRPGQRLVIPKE